MEKLYKIYGHQISFETSSQKLLKEVLWLKRCCWEKEEQSCSGKEVCHLRQKNIFFPLTTYKSTIQTFTFIPRIFLAKRRNKNKYFIEKIGFLIFFLFFFCLFVFFLVHFVTPKFSLCSWKIPIFWQKIPTFSVLFAKNSHFFLLFWCLLPLDTLYATTTDVPHPLSAHCMTMAAAKYFGLSCQISGFHFLYSNANKDFVPFLDQEHRTLDFIGPWRLFHFNWTFFYLRYCSKSRSEKGIRSL